MGVMPQFVHLCKIISSNLATDAMKSRIFVTSGRIVLQMGLSFSGLIMITHLGSVGPDPGNSHHTEIYEQS